MPGWTESGDPILADLTSAQREAVTHEEGPLLILAGAGSGKTRVITRRVAWLIRQGVKPPSILAITFTNKAAGEMRQRLEKLVSVSNLWVSTFHSLGTRLLRTYADRLGLDRHFTIYDTDDRKKLVKEAFEAAGVTQSRFSPELIGGAISRAKNQLLTPERYPAKDFFTETVARVYAVYQRRLREANAVDFDDLLLLPALALRHDAQLREELQERFRFLLIDEYQDTNGAQYELARHLSMRHRNICVVGDPDQSIYKFRGSDIRIILDFERDFPDAKVIVLEKNYRSTGNILQAADTLIAHNKQRKPKRLVTDNPQGPPVKVLVFNDGLEEADQVAARIHQAVRGQGRRFRDFAIFLRTNALSRTLESAFVKYGVPYQMVRGLAFFERKENRDILAYLRLLLNPKDDLSFLRVVNEPARGVGKTTLEHLRAYAAPRSLSLLEAAAEAAKIPAIKGKAASGLQQFVRLIQGLRELREQPPDEIVHSVIERSGYGPMLRDSGNEEDIQRYENIKELVTAATQFVREDSSRTLGDFLETVALASDVDSWDDAKDHVSVMTLHAAKGLEFPVVYILAVEQGILPHARSLEQPEDIEEERRLCFVGMTRAKEELYLCRANYREFTGQQRCAIPSEFLLEMESVVECDDFTIGSGSSATARFWRGGPEAALKAWSEAGTLPASSRRDAKGTFRVGCLVEHAEYGLGRIVEISGLGALRRMRIRFRQGEKIFAGDHVKLTLATRYADDGESLEG
jgi:DNA helicase-2/ATP-dependent DNA helicase PcrA